MVSKSSSSMICDRVREDAAFVSGIAKHVRVLESADDAEKVMRVVERLGGWKALTFDTEMHVWPGMDLPEGSACRNENLKALTVQYLLVVDAMNFCFWPVNDADHRGCCEPPPTDALQRSTTTGDESKRGDNNNSCTGMEYEHLACGIRDMVLRDPKSISAERLRVADDAWLYACLGAAPGAVRGVPLAKERLRLVREVGDVLLSKFGGCAWTMVAQAGGSASTLVDLIATHFRGFQDHAVYRGRQVLMLKRAQIFVGDVWGAFLKYKDGRENPISRDINSLTMFADYRVPAVLRAMNMLQYSPELAAMVDNGELIASGSAMETEIRTSTIHALERLRIAIQQRMTPSTTSSDMTPAGANSARDDNDSTFNALSSATHDTTINSVRLDWALWHYGETMRDVMPHHRTITVYY